MDNFKNFAKVTVSTGYDASATSIALSAGHGARFPAASFNATWWNSTDYADPSDDPNREIVRVTAISTDTLTVTRGQESILASTKNTSGKTYRMVAALTAKTLTEFQLTGVLKGNGTSAPTAMTGATNQIAVWTDENTIAGSSAWSIVSGVLQAAAAQSITTAAGALTLKPHADTPLVNVKGNLTVVDYTGSAVGNTLIVRMDATACDGTGNVSIQLNKKTSLTASSYIQYGYGASSVNWYVGTGVLDSLDDYKVMSSDFKTPFRIVTAGNVDDTFVIKAGSVGIRTTNPGSNLEVNAGSATLTKDILTVKGGGGGGSYGLDVQANNGDVVMRTDNFSYQTLFYSGTVSSPAIAGNSYANTGLYWSAGPNLNISSNGVNAVTIKNGGNVGIGLTGPTAVLHLKAGTATASTAPLKLTTQAVVLTTPEQGAFELVGNSLQFTQLVKRRGVVMSQAVITSTISANETTSETAALITAEHGSGYLEVGKMEEIVLRGTISQRANPAATISIRVKYAGVTLLTSTSPTTTVIAADTPFEIRVSTTCRSTGATGTLQINFVFWIDGVANIPDTETLATINTTTAENTTITAQWGEAHASDLFSVHQGRVLCVETNK